MRVHVFGENAIAKEFARSLSRRGDHADISQTDTSDDRELWGALGASGVELVIDCSERDDMKWCESHPQQAFKANVLGPLTLEKYCKEKHIRLMRTTSSHVYHGDVGGWPFFEHHAPNWCKSVHSRTVAMAQGQLEQDVLQLRIGSLIMDRPSKDNIITQIVTRGYAGIIPESVIALDDLINAGVHLLQQGAGGIYNIANPGGISEASMMHMYRCHVDPALHCDDLNPVGIERKDPLRTYCVLGTEKLEKTGLVLRPAKEALAYCCDDYFLRLLSGT